MGGMRLFSRVFCFFILVIAVYAFARDIVAKTSNDSTVVLHDDGRWEYIQGKNKNRDVHDRKISEDTKFNVIVEYEKPERVRQNLRLAMEANLATEEKIRDSLRTVPKGGYVYFQVKTSQIDKNRPRKLTYFLYDGGKKPIFTKIAYDVDAVPSEQSGISNLLVIPVYGRPKSNMMLARVQARNGMETLDIDIPVR